MSHTPGPWNIIERVNHLAVVNEPDNIRKRRLTISKIPLGPPEYRNERKADANLIAAAPDLLAELENIANARPDKWDDEVRDDFKGWAQSRARYAIAKARGK